MVRVIALSLFVAVASAIAQEELSNGLITANQVDVTADDGSLLPDRLNVGDIVYIVTKPASGKRNGWVRVSRSPDDKIGYGWVEQKHIRTFNNYKDLSGGSATASAPVPSAPSSPISDPGLPSVGSGGPEGLDGIPFAPEESFAAPAPVAAASGKYKKVGVVRFQAQLNDGFVASSFDSFSEAMAKTGLSVSPLQDAVKIDSEAALQKLSDRNKLDGVFVGNISDPLDDGRLVQVKFYSAKDKKFVVEKVTRIPMSGDPKNLIQNFAQSIVDQLNNPL